MPHYIKSIGVWSKWSIRCNENLAFQLSITMKFLICNNPNPDDHQLLQSCRVDLIARIQSTHIEKCVNSTSCQYSALHVAWKVDHHAQQRTCCRRSPMLNTRIHTNIIFQMQCFYFRASCHFSSLLVKRKFLVQQRQQQQQQKRTVCSVHQSDQPDKNGHKNKSTTKAIFILAASLVLSLKCVRMAFLVVVWIVNTRSRSDQEIDREFLVRFHMWYTHHNHTQDVWNMRSPASAHRFMRLEMSRKTHPMLLRFYCLHRCCAVVVGHFWA